MIMMIYVNIRLMWLFIFLAYFRINGIERKTYGPEIRILNIDKVWAQNITGKDVVVAVLDDGVNYNHHDLKYNYEQTVSYDFVGNDTSPLPNREMTHGTQCAGIIAARQHGYCRTGIAYNAKLAGIRLFNGMHPNTDNIVRGFGYMKNVIDIYSNSWGPADSGFSMKRPGRRQQNALEEGAKYGRNGLGSIFVFSSGNGGRFGDSCAFDGYVNNIHTIAIGAFSLNDKVPRFSERCSSVLASAYGDNVKTCSGSYWQCANDFGRTSAAAAMASGIIALVLEANNKLTWRDVQHLIVRTSNPRGANIDSREWTVNGAGLMFNPAMGFGVMNAKKLVDAARNNWKTVPQQRSCSVEISYLPKYFPSTGGIVRFSSKRTNECSKIKALEHVQVEFSLEFQPRAIVEMFLTSPQGTKSQLLYKRPYDALSSKKRYNGLRITSLHFWGENPTGQWTILLKSAESLRSLATSSYVTLKKWKVTFYGTEKDPLSDNLLPKGTITCGRKKFWISYGSRCCGSSWTFEPQRERCCPAIFKVMNKNLRCGSIPYNGCEKMCCNGVLQNKVKDNVTMSCCGPQSYNKNKQICCGDRLDTRGICKYNWWRNGWFIHKNKCLSDRSTRLVFTEESCTRPRPVQGPITCGGKTIWANYGSRCCGSLSTFNPQHERCCPRTFTIMSKNLRCGSIPYNGCENICCNGVLQNKVKDNVTMSCCGTQSYDKNKQICCGDRLETRNICKYNRRRNGWFIHQNKCLSNGYISSVFTEKSCSRSVQSEKGLITCGGKTFWINNGSRCCGSWSIYNPQRARCCPGSFKIINKNLRCGSILYNGCEKMCCNGMLQNKIKDNVAMSCCGTHSYDKNKQICCGDRLHTRYQCRFNNWKSAWFIYQNKCFRNRHTYFLATEESCGRPKPVQSKEVCKDKLRHCHTFTDCREWRTLQYKRENCAKTCGLC